MGALKKFIEEWKSKSDQKLLNANQEANAIAEIRSEMIALSNIGETEKDSFAKEMVQFATSNEFVDILDNKLAPPLPFETKEMFVERALGTIRKIMLDKMD